MQRVCIGDGCLGLLEQGKVIKDTIMFSDRGGEMAGIKVTVGIPVYNSESHISTCLESVLNQTMAGEEIEILAVNDGSTDRSGEILDEFALKIPTMRVIHQENSGGPGAPRNTIIEKARGEYIFFVDADDFLGAEAIEKMYEMGKENDTDIILGKFVGVNGRGVAQSMFHYNQPKTSVFDSEVIHAIGPTKMFRRLFLIENDICFPVSVKTAEDQPFMVKAYVLAQGISVVADYPCYYVVNHSDKEHASVVSVNPKDYYETIANSIKIIHDYVKDKEKKEVLLSKYLDKELNTGRSILFAASELPLTEKLEWLGELNNFLQKWITESVVERLSMKKKVFLYFARNKDLKKMIDFLANDGTQPGTMTEDIMV